MGFEISFLELIQGPGHSFALMEFVRHSELLETSRKFSYNQGVD